MTVPPIVYVSGLSETTGAAAAIECASDKSAEIAVVIARSEIDSQLIATPTTKAALLMIHARRNI
jgi:hypothetical protein